MGNKNNTLSLAEVTKEHNYNANESNTTQVDEITDKTKDTKKQTELQRKILQQQLAKKKNIKPVKKINKDKLTVFGLMKEYRKLLPNITRYNIPNLVCYCILSYYEDDGEYFRICDESKIKLEYDNRKAMTLTYASSVYGSHLIYIHEQQHRNNIYTWQFRINECYLMAIGLVDGNCTKTSYDFTNKNNSYAYYSDSNIFIKYGSQSKHFSADKLYQGDTIKMVLNLRDKPQTLTYYRNRFEHPTFQFEGIGSLITCSSLRLAVCLYNHERDDGVQFNSQITLTEFHVQRGYEIVQTEK